MVKWKKSTLLNKVFAPKGGGFARMRKQAKFKPSLVSPGYKAMSVAAFKAKEELKYRARRMMHRPLY